MNTLKNGLRMAVIYALSIIVSGVFLVNCANASVAESKALANSGLNTSKSSQKGSLTSKTKVKDNLRIVMRIVDRENESEHRFRHGYDHGRDCDRDRYEHRGRKEHCEKEFVSLDKVYLTVDRVEAFNPAMGWVVVQPEDTYGNTIEIFGEPGTEIELGRAPVLNGDYTEIRVYLTNDNYVVINGNGELLPLAFKPEREHHRYGHGEESGADNRLEIEDYQTVVVQENYVTTVYLEVDPYDLVDRKKHREHREKGYYLDAEVQFAEYELVPCGLDAPSK